MNRSGLLLDLVYRLDDSGQHRSAVDVILDYIDSLLIASDYELCDEVFTAIDIEKLSLSSIVSFLGITRTVPVEQLPSREKFYADAIVRLARDRGELAAQHLLEKYRRHGTLIDGRARKSN